MKTKNNLDHEINSKQLGSSQSISYLGCPYSDPDPEVRRYRERAVTQMAFDLHAQGILVYSPLTHNLPIDKLGVFGDFQTWMNFDHGMLVRCDRLFVFKLPGWENSKGLKAEIERAQALNLPVEELIPDELFLKKIACRDDSITPVQELLKHIDQLVEERDWSQFHSPKNLAMNLQVEIGEVAEHFTWLTEEQSRCLPPGKKQEVADEIGDVLISLVQLSDKLGVDLFSSAMRKIEKIKKKYPAHLAKGKAFKYTYYE